MFHAGRASATIESFAFDLVTLTGEPNSVCEGDSGGPSFLTSAGGQSEVIGVHYGVQHQATCDGFQYDTAVHLFAAGVAERVVKADVASLYPSLPVLCQTGSGETMWGVTASGRNNAR